MRKQDAVLARAERDKWKKISKQHKKCKNQRYIPLVLHFIIILFKYIDK